ncbi:phage portal protein [Streptomyces showdoensis]|uniref:phage portal protein n=1 Tax=Streptomyces showdoensis TaxID=68268 RepID=UPI000F516ACA|nr:phage portal protein [Streptomyces showdoensis]
MGFLRSALSGLATPERWVEDWMRGGSVNSAGIRVDQDTALTYSPFFAGVRVLSEDLAGLPLFLYERLQPRGKQRATTHPLYRLLHDQPNDMMSSAWLREVLTSHAITWGNGLGYVVSNERTGVVEEIWPLRPDRVTIGVKRSGPGRFERRYRYDDDVNGIHTVLLPHEVLHISGLGFDGVQGYPVVELAANSIGLGLATEHHGAKVFSNGAAPGGALTHPGNVSPEARRRMADDWENIHKGIDRAHRIAVLEEGVTFQQVGVPNDSAQFLETRKLQVTEMARWLRLPPHKVGDLDRATFSNIEQQQLDYIGSALNVWLVRWEQAILTQLLLPDERQQHFPEFLVDSLLRGDTAARYAAYAVGRQWGWLSANDVRDKENLNPIEGGDDYLVPLNMVPAGRSAGRDATAVRRARLLAGRNAVRETIADKWGQKIEASDQDVADLEADEVGALVDEHLTAGRGARSLGAFLAALRVLYAEDGPIMERLAELWVPLMTGFADDIAVQAAEAVAYEDPVDLSVWANAYALSHAGYQVSSSYGQLRAVVDKTEGTTEDIAEAVVERLAKWQEERPAHTARWESSQLPNAAARETWKEAGVKKIQWVARGSQNCPYCQRLDGAVRAIEKPFVAKGDDVEGDEGEALTAKRDTFHPPVHPGCNCEVIPVVD